MYGTTRIGCPDASSTVLTSSSASK